MTDPISDMLTRIRNAQAVKKSEVVLPYSNLKLEILKLMEQKGWLKKVEVLNPVFDVKNNKLINRDKNLRFQRLKVEILYEKDNTPKIKSLKRISKPGRRVYAAKDKLPRVLNDYGIAIISTSKGLMTNKEARKQGTGGEVLCEIY